MLGANPLVRDNVLTLLGAMAYHCVFAPSLKEALVLHEKEKPDAAILGPQQADSSPAGTVAAFHRKFPGLRGRTIVLTGEQATPELLKVLDAYSLPQVPLHLLRLELWPCLDSLLIRNIVPQQVTGNARLVLIAFSSQYPIRKRSARRPHKSPNCKDNREVELRKTCFPRIKDKERR